jgi:acetolactate synthase-1/2/3 large subunit
MRPVNAQEVIDSFARAYRVAMQEPQGPVYLCYDAAFQEDRWTASIRSPTRARQAQAPGCRRTLRPWISWRSGC